MNLFVTFEGPEGSGKTTQIRSLAAALQACGQAVLTTREPGGTRIGNAVRTLLLDRTHTEMVPRAETLLFSAARAQIVEQVIRPALARGEIVLCDRYADSTLAYQGYGYGQSLDELRLLNRYATGGLWPDLTVYLDLDPMEGLQRKRSGSDEEWNRMEAKALAFHRAVHEGYRALARQEAERWLCLDARRPAAEVHGLILERVLGMQNALAAQEPRP